jgi:alkanesulfonate monooxygenase SsuD/methylene tetrahydromethanopterin reductase-like flavin-dependent oxidoreductase (luciferase family)
MKFMFFFYPAIPATMDEREKLRPIAARTDRFQQMLEEIVELSQMAEDLGFEAVCYPEHHFHTEGGEMGTCWPAGIRSASRSKSPGSTKSVKAAPLPALRAAIKPAG